MQKTGKTKRLFDNLRILHVIDHWGCGGAPVAVRRISEQQRRDGLSVYVLSLRRDSAASNGCMVLGSGKYSLIRAGRKLRQVIRKCEIDIIHAHLTHSLVVSTLFSPVPVVYHEHGPVVGHELYARLHRAFLKWQPPKAVIACSDYLNWAVKRLGVQNVYTIGNPVPWIETSRAWARRTFNYKDDDYVIGYLGRLAPNKNLKLFVEMAYLLTTLPIVSREHLKFLIIGDGPYFNKMYSMIRDMGIDDLFTFYGESNDPLKLAAAFDVAVQMAKYGSFGQAVLELMGLGVPVIVPPVGAFSEVIEDRVNGFIAQNCSDQALADCVMTAYRNDVSGICQRAVAGTKDFRPTRIARQIMKVYREVLQ